jgi:hypothetical protein
MIFLPKDKDVPATPNYSVSSVPLQEDEDEPQSRYPSPKLVATTFCQENDPPPKETDTLKRKKKMSFKAFKEGVKKVLQGGRGKKEPATKQ